MIQVVNIRADNKTVTAVAKFELPSKVVTSLLQPAMLASREAAMRRRV